MYLQIGYFWIILESLFNSARSNEERCFTIKQDPRNEPGEMELDPGNYMNIFTDLRVTYSGRLESVTFYPQNAGDVFISFWNNTENNTYVLLQKVLVNAAIAKQVTTVDVSSEEIEVIKGSCLAIHYQSDQNTGVIDYSKDDTLFQLYSTISTAVRGVDIGYEVNQQPTEMKTAALHLTVCGIGQCFKIKLDPRYEPGDMEINPGNYMHIFTDLIVQSSGILETVTFFPENTGDVFISFWNNTETNIYVLLQKVLVNAATARQVTTVNVSSGGIEIIKGSCVAIHYPSSTTENIGVIDYSEDGTLFKLYSTIATSERGVEIGHVVNKTPSINRTAALHLTICALCEDTTYGYNCTPCSAQCAGNQSCDSYNGTCDYGCINGYIGPKCIDACDEGYYGRDCAFNCSVHCANATTCLVETGHCPHGCKAGYQQPFCDIECPLNYFGENCSQRCGNCLYGETCHHVDGTCANGCQDGYQFTPLCNEECIPGTYGRNCASYCSGNCYGNETCSIFNGTCERCDAGYDFTLAPLCDLQCQLNYFGENCSKECSGNCRDGATCHHVDGTCEHGCQDGYQFTPQCTEECVPGTYGRNCTYECSGNCYGNETCSRINGTCERCDAGYDFSKSPLCDTPCTTAAFGPNCQHSCYCKDGAPCDAVSGYCSNYACEPGWQGWNCSVPQECTNPSTSGILDGGIVILLLLVASMVFNGIFLYKRFRPERNKHEEVHEFVSINEIRAGEVNNGLVADEGKKSEVDVSTPSDRYMTPHESPSPTASPIETESVYATLAQNSNSHTYQTLGASTTPSTESEAVYEEAVQNSSSDAYENLSACTR